MSESSLIETRAVSVDMKIKPIVFILYFHGVIFIDHHKIGETILKWHNALLLGNIKKEITFEKVESNVTTSQRIC